MADSETPAADSQQQEAEQEEMAAGVGDTEETTGDAPQENGESQEPQKEETTEVKPDGESSAADGNGGDGDADTAGGNKQQEPETERQPTPAAAVSTEEATEEPKIAESNGTAQEPQEEVSGQPESTPVTEAESKQEPEEKTPVEEPEVQQQQESVPEMTMSEEQKKRCRHYFDKRCVDGRLDLKGFKLLFRLMGEVLSAEDANKMFQGGNRDDNNTIDFDEFCRLYCCHGQEEHSRKAAMLESIDKLFPGDDKTPVELKKVKGLLLHMQRPDLDMRLVREKSDLNPGDIHRLVKTMDTQGTGRVSKQEFVDTLCKHLEHM